MLYPLRIWSTAFSLSSCSSQDAMPASGQNFHTCCNLNPAISLKGLVPALFSPLPPTYLPHFLLHSPTFPLGPYPSLGLGTVPSQQPQVNTAIQTCLASADVPSITYHPRGQSLDPASPSEAEISHTSSSSFPSTRSSHEAMLPSESSASDFAGLNVLEM